MFKSSLIACAVLATAFQAHALDFHVTGTITPNACTVAMAGGGVAAYGTLTAGTVRSTWTHATTGGYDRYVNPASKIVPFAVTCPTPTKFALSFIDNRAASTNFEPGQNSVSFGLGFYGAGASSASIGNYLIDGRFIALKATATSGAVVPGKLFVTPGVAASTSVFTAATGVEAAGYIPNDKSLAFGLTAAATTPDAVAGIVGDLYFVTEIKKSVLDAATADIQIDGSGTLTLIVL